MKIVKLTAENVKRLVAVEITPDGSTVVIAGKNAQGKSSVLDAIWLALGGGPAARGTSRPIRNGQEHARVSLDLGELIVTRTWTAGGKSTLKVETAEGAQYKSPQSMLDALVGRLTFDPLAFAQQDEKTQLSTLLDLVDLPFDPEQLAARRLGLYEKRTEVGRVGKQLEGQLAGMPRPAEDLPGEEVSISDLVDEHRAAVAQHAERDKWVREAEGCERSAERYRERIQELEQALAEARATAAEQEKDANAAHAHVDRLTADLPDLASIETRLAEADEVNAAVRAARLREDVAAKLADAHGKYSALTDQIRLLDEEKAAAIAGAAMPIDGLAFDDDGVTYRGVPFKQCSSAEQLRVSLAMAMAMNPKIRVVRITDGSLLDSDNMRLIEEMAAANDYQVWIERVDESGRVGVIIEDGHVRESAAAS